MTVGIEEIRAWVDAELDEPRADAVANAVMSDEFLRHTAEKLRASRLPYRQAYAQALVSDVPQSLRIQIAALRGPVVKSPDVQNLSTRAANHAVNNSSFRLFGIAASLMIAVLVGYLSGTNTATHDSPAALADTQMHPENFARTVAAYQKFYVRDTLKGAVPPDPARVTERLASQTGMQVKIPELEGYQFIRAQRLSFGGELLLQLVYLGAEGRPLALCYMAVLESGAGNENSSRDTATLKTHHGLNTAEWRNNGHRFVIVSDAPENKLLELSLSTRQQWNS